MSAFVVAREHIDALVLAGVQFGLLTDVRPEPLAQLGTALWAENRYSVNYRYAETGPRELYSAPTAEVILDPMSVVKATDCYVYQSCEHPGWADSAAAAYCARLREAALAAVPVIGPARIRDLRNIPAYDRAPWAVDDLADVTVQAAARRDTR